MRVLEAEEVSDSFATGAVTLNLTYMKFFLQVFEDFPSPFWRVSAATVGSRELI